jgi:hypothetical protein
VPSDHRFGLHEEQRRAPAGPEAGKPNPKHSVGRVQTETTALRPLEDGELMAESQNLNLQCCPGLEPRSEVKERGKQESEHRVGTIPIPLGNINNFNLVEIFGRDNASQYKDYVLVLLFVKYVLDIYAGQKDVLLDLPKGGSFADMVALKGDKAIGDKINKIISRLAEANELKGMIDVADFNDADKPGKRKEMVDRLSSLVSIFDNPALDFRAHRAEVDDILGDAYEYLMRHFATESGKSKGQFYMPAGVPRMMAKVIGRGQRQRHGGSLCACIKLGRHVNLLKLRFPRKLIDTVGGAYVRGPHSSPC